MGRGVGRENRPPPPEILPGLHITQGAIDKLRALGISLVTDGTVTVMVEVGVPGKDTKENREVRQKVEALRAAQDEGVLDESKDVKVL